MKIFSFIFLLFSFIFITSPIYADEIKDNLIVYGKKFAFKVKEPVNWHGDIDNAKRFHCNIIFYPKYSHRVTLVIRVKVNSKVYEDLEKDLIYDMQQYKKQYTKIKFKDINVSHLEYDIFSKLFYVHEDFYEYVTYINPGIGIKIMLSVSMNIQKREATEEELAAYTQIIESLWFLTEDVRMN